MTRRASGLPLRTRAYLKIAEGCNHPCSFCVIPQMRGTSQVALPIPCSQKSGDSSAKASARLI